MRNCYPCCFLYSLYDMTEKRDDMREKLEIDRYGDGIHTLKENCTAVDYFIYSEYEIHLNSLPSGAVQEWHYHSDIEEVLVITKGILTCKWKENGEIRTDWAKKKEIVRVQNSIHTFQNDTEDDTEFLVFRFVPDGVDKRERIKNDKKLIKETEEI